ncbi:hypothetical protein SeMB42_g04238 [Synchytrium endobioticum]|uniref:UBX domain-containing protein n=1 Tax=Synchytrium endobioticum TaxID=286115 RepID=A0A507CN81_9FUNG|nr:hypothetical protein SeLEV6574_g06547 [Synchytrium endobioticum]TPX44726.1 hypothetical protein SeMB42_g04238 [Synchytrium endobioticum]
MASMVNIEWDGAPYKKVAIKTTPMMNLRSIADQAVEKLKLQDPPSTYGLKYQKNTLDLSLSVRFANLAAGAKLTLVKSDAVNAAAASVVSIALQVEDGGRLTGAFSPSVSFWDILVFFESQSNGTLNLTQRAEIPPKEKQGNLLSAIKELAKKNTPVYMMPVCLFVNKEYGTFQELKTATLASAGLTSGNGVIRLLYRYTEKTLAQAKGEADGVVAVKNESLRPVIQASTLNSSTVPSSSTTIVEPLKSLAHSLSASIQPEPVVAAVLSLPQTASATAMEVDTPPASTIPSPTAQNSVISSTSIIQTLPSSATTVCISIRPNTAASVDEQSVESNDGSSTLDRDIKYFRPPPQDIIGPGGVELPDSFYELTPAELKMLLASSKSRRLAEESRVLQTRAMREREVAFKNHKWPKTMIRVRFPDRTTLQAQFFSSEKLTALYDIVRCSVANPQREFSLHITPPMKILSDQELTFWTAGLAPASLVYFAWRDRNTTVGGPLLSEEVQSQLQDYPLPKDTATVPSTPSSEAPMKSATNPTNSLLLPPPQPNATATPADVPMRDESPPSAQNETALGDEGTGSWGNGQGRVLGIPPSVDDEQSVGRGADEKAKKILKWLKLPARKC